MTMSSQKSGKSSNKKIIGLFDQINKLNTVNKSTTDLKPIIKEDIQAAYNQGEVDLARSGRQEITSVRSSTSILDKLKDRNIN